MDLLHTIETKALVELQRRDIALDALKARAAAVTRSKGSRCLPKLVAASATGLRAS